MAQTTAPMVKNARSDATRGCNYDGCSCHTTKNVRRKAKKGAKRAETRRWRREEGLDGR